MAIISKHWNSGPTAPDTAVNAGEVFPPSVTNQIELGMKLDLDGLGLTAGLFQIESAKRIYRCK